MTMRTSSDVIQNGDALHGHRALCVPLPVHHISLHVAHNDIQEGRLFPGGWLDLRELHGHLGMKENDIIMA